MGIPLGHKLKMMKKIKEMRASKGMSVPQSAQSTRSKAASIAQTPESSQIKYEDGASTRPVTNNVYEELPVPTNYSQSTQESMPMVS